MKTRDELTTEIYDRAVKLGLWCPKMTLNGYCWDGATETECGEVYSDFWHVKIFDNGTFQLGWLEYRNGTTLVTKRVNTIEEVYDFLAKQR